MDKKIILSAVMSVLAFAGCSDVKESVITETSQGEIQIEQSTIQSETDFIEIVTDLMEKNAVCIKMFMSGIVEYADEPLIDNCYQLINSDFADYSELENFVNGIYSSEEAERILHNYPYEGSSIYKDCDGVLCVDLNVLAPKGYFVDWNNVEVEITNSDADHISFKAKASAEYPGENISEDYEAAGEAVNENGHWVLEEMIY